MPTTIIILAMLHHSSAVSIIQSDCRFGVQRQRKQYMIIVICAYRYNISHLTDEQSNFAGSVPISLIENKTSESLLKGQVMQSTPKHS